MKNVNVSKIVLGWCFTFDTVYRMFDNRAHNALPVNIESRFVKILCLVSTENIWMIFAVVQSS